MDCSSEVASSSPSFPLQALDCTLPESHPYHRACGLRAGSDASLVSGLRLQFRCHLANAHGLQVAVPQLCARSSSALEPGIPFPVAPFQSPLCTSSILFVPLQVSLEFCSFPPSYRHPKVPEGLQYYTLQAQLSGKTRVGSDRRLASPSSSSSCLPLRACLIPWPCSHLCVIQSCSSSSSTASCPRNLPTSPLNLVANRSHSNACRAAAHFPLPVPV